MHGLIFVFTSDQNKKNKISNIKSKNEVKLAQDFW